MKRVKVAFSVLALWVCCGSAVRADDINCVTVRGIVQDNVFDCSGFGCSINHGCLLSVSTHADDPFVVHIAYGVGGDCTSIAADDCVQISGRIGNFTSLNASVGSYQLEATAWSSSMSCSP